MSQTMLVEVYFFVVMYLLLGGLYTLTKVREFESTFQHRVLWKHIMQRCVMFPIAILCLICLWPMAMFCEQIFQE